MCGFDQFGVGCGLFAANVTLVMNVWNSLKATIFITRQVAASQINLNYPSIIASIMRLLFVDIGLFPK